MSARGNWLDIVQAPRFANVPLMAPMYDCPCNNAEAEFEDEGGGRSSLLETPARIRISRGCRDLIEPRSTRGGKMGVSKLSHRGSATLFLLALVAVAQPLMGADYPTPREGDFQIEDFEFASGEVLPELNLHYTTIGQPRRDASGLVRNAILIMHGTTGRGGGFLSERFAGALFGAGQLLDAERYYIILTDAIGHGRSSRPSDGLHMSFPKYTYDDMVRAQYRLLTEHLGVDHLRLVMGTSMGGMHTWVWGYTYPEFMDALMPLASLPVEIAGRNRMLRKMIIDSVRNDPEWNGGEYSEQPPGLIWPCTP
jgi:homoserine O-acetyltransferase